MGDVADDSDQRIMDSVNEGISRARRALNTQRLTPIIQELDGMRFGVCYWCESPIRPGTLFCCKECGDDYSYEKQRHKDMGVR